ncbi:MAG: hypothetical protein IJ307_03620 [Bacteroidales bacterium]|jgi:hypothetical protein|nr:hypothetical protein [Bacteroidales bacterium]MBR2856797.1 hypothetical protein [Bacteroidales bacterium]
MEETEILIEALGQIPELVEAAKTYKASNEKTISTMSMAIKKRPEAEIPQKEVEKVTDAVKATPCALPDTDDFLKAIAGMMRPIIHQEVKEAVGATKIKIQHEHRHDHYSYSASWSMVKDTAKKLIIGLAISTLILTVTLVAVLVHFTNSEMYLGKKYMELYQSDLLTKSEKEKLLKDAYMVSLYPEAYEGYPKAFRERLRKNKSIVDDRELEKIVKGKFSVKEKVGF